MQFEDDGAQPDAHAKAGAHVRIDTNLHYAFTGAASNTRLMWVKPRRMKVGR